jgi:hypothetical protein
MSWRWDDTRVTADDFRELALGLPGAVEGAHMNHPDFRANGRIFASLHADDVYGTVKLTPEQQAEFLRDAAGTFVPASGAWGRQGYTQVRLASAHAATVRGALTLAWENVTSAPPPRPKKKRASIAKAAPRPRQRR